MAEERFTLFIAEHCSVNACDHLTNMCKKAFSDSKIAENMKLYRKKCTSIIKHILYPYFLNDLNNDIDEAGYSIFIDKSTDISVTKFLGIVIIYFNLFQKKIVSTYLALATIEECSAKALENVVKSILKKYNLLIDNKKLVGIGTDNASVMTGVNNGLCAKLKVDQSSLIRIIRCLCHSLQIAASKAVKETLSQHLAFIVSGTYNWFSRSCLRQQLIINLTV